MRTEKYIKLICIEISISIVVTKCQVLKSTYYLEKDRKGIFPVVRTVHNTFLMGCAFACRKTEGCLKANFNTLKRKCYLGSDKHISVDDSEGWTHMNLRDKTFEMSLIEKTWVDAQMDCESSGGSLATILAQWENMEALSAMVASKNKTSWKNTELGVWIGGRRNAQGWYWPNGTSYTDEIIGPYWGPDEPNSELDECLRYYYHYTWFGLLWDDYTCTTPQPFLCQYSLNNG